MKRLARITMIAVVACAALLALGGAAFLQLPSFGAEPGGARLQAILQSPHQTGGVFRNLVDTPVLAPGESTLSIIVHDRLQQAANLSPPAALPTTRTDLKALDPAHDAVVWLGHSSFFVILAGRRVLIDPVLSDHASPLSFAVPAFAGTTLYRADDLPDIDLLLITHDHWDHLDHATLTTLRSRVNRALVPLGVGAHLERWGFKPEQIHEADWHDTLRFGRDLAVHLVPARHYSGRGLTRNKTLWTAFVLEAPGRLLLFGGDSGYGPHFAEIGRRFGAFDLVALDLGQYDPRWPFIHMTPEQAARAAVELGAKRLLPAHAGRFALARHGWDEPFERIVAASQGQAYRLVTPRIGEPLPLDAKSETQAWWRASRP